MDITNYIASGMVEGYLFGLASPEERVEFERRLKMETELQDEYHKAQQLLKLYSSCFTVECPLKATVLWQQLETSAVPEEPRLVAVPNIPVTPPEPLKQDQVTAPELVSAGSEVPQTSMSAKQPAANRPWKLAALFGVLSFIGAGALALTYKVDRDALRDQIGKVTLDYQSLEHEFQVKQEKHQQDSLLIHFFNQNGIRVYELSGTEHLYMGWNSKTGELNLWDVHLPSADAEKKYIFWAMQQEKVLCKSIIKMNDCSGLQDVGSIDRSADQYLITLEEPDASEPDMEELIAKTIK